MGSNGEAGSEGPGAASPPRAVVGYLVTGERPASAGTEDLALLDAAERARMQRFARLDDARDFAAAHALLRRTLSRLHPGTVAAAWRFAADARGRPEIVATERADPSPLPRVSLSHTRGLVACAVAVGADVGVDVERDGRRVDLARLVPEICAPSEAAALATLDPEPAHRRFLDLWTLKEAWGKAYGVGLRFPLAGLAFDLDRPGRIAVAPEIAGSRCRIALYRPSPEARLAVVVAAAQPLAAPFEIRVFGEDGTAPLTATAVGP